MWYLVSMRLLVLTLLLGLLVACERSDPRDAHAVDDSEVDHAGASYGRDLLFLAGSGVEPTAMVFRYTAVTESDHVRRSARAWLGRNGRWSDLLEADWRGPAMRQAWRIVPHGPLRVIADAGGDLEALVHRDEERTFRLMPASAVTEWSPTELSHFRVRIADLLLENEPLGGVLLDVQAGSLTPGDPATMTAFLTDGRDLYLVVAAGPDNRSPAWLRLGFREEGWEGVGFENDEEDAALIHFGEPQGQLFGELRLTGTELPVGAESPDSVALDSAEEGGVQQTIVLQTTNGWVEVHGERRPVYGVVQQVRE